MIELTVATYNIRNSRAFDGRDSWWFRRRNTLRVLQELHADVVSLQEVRPNQLRWLRKKLEGDFDIVGVGRDDGRAGGEHVVFLVRRSMGTIVDVEPRWFTDDFTTPSRHPEAGFNRFLLKVSVSIGGTTVDFVGTHLDERSHDARRDACDRMAAWFGGSAIFLGDFNCRIDDAALTSIFASGCRDALSQLEPEGPGVATHHSFTGTTNESRIDHIFVPASTSVEQSRVVHWNPRGSWASDHWPVVAKVRIHAGRG